MQTAEQTSETSPSERLTEEEEEEFEGNEVQGQTDKKSSKRRLDPLYIGEEEIAKKIYISKNHFAFKRGARIVFVGSSQSGKGLKSEAILYCFRFVAIFPFLVPKHHVICISASRESLQDLVQSF